MKITKKITVLCLLFALAFSTLPVNVLAVESSNQNMIGLCEHHTEHDADCGYTEGSEGSPCTFVCEICDKAEQSADPAEKKIVSEWTWKLSVATEDKVAEKNLNKSTGNMPVYQNDRWELTLPATSADHPMSKEQVIELLPKEIVLTCENLEEEQQSKLNQKVAALTWEIVDYPAKGAVSGEFIATATLPAEYLLKEGVAPLQIFLTFRASVDVTTLKKHELNSTISPAGTKINLFDYWLSDNKGDRQNSDHQPLKPDGTENHDEDLKEDVEGKSKGINKNHVLKFISHGGNWQGYNYWTGNENPHEGIVGNKLDKNGYPVVENEPKDFTWSDWNNNIYDTENDKVGSLNYLFDPNTTHPGKASFENAKNLLQIDDNGYYYYDAGKNYARFDEKTKEFILYDAPAVYRNNTNDPNPGQFFPFQTEDQVSTYYKGVKDDGTLELDDSINPASDKVNHYFGMTMETRFVHKNGGENYQGQDITYEFSGDDDVWVFIDGVLIADLGGIHDKATFKINFHTGNISVNGTQKNNIKNQFVAAGEGEDKKFSGNTFADNTYHTLKFFFLERGNHESNMSLRYNLFPIPESELIKVDQMGEPVEGVEFTMYTADKKYDINEEIFTGTTDEKGYIYLRDDLGMPMTFAQLYDKYGAEYFVLKENNSAPGYRKLKDIHLHYKIYNKEKNIGVVETDENNLWETGAYAQAKVTATAPNKIRYGKINDSDQAGELDLSNTATVPNNLLMFAVVFQKNGDNWYPMSGDALSGWKVATDNKWKSVLAAARDNPYLFHLETNGAFQTEIENLPGNVEEYYSFLKQNGNENQAKYYVAYYYSTADDLHQATAENTYQILNQIESNDEYKDFTREFASKLYVPNIKNSLLVHKMDEKMQALNDATFCLYKEKDITINNDGSYTIKENATPYDKATTEKLTGMNGGIVFPSSGKVLDMGIYYLIETEAPEGYEKNPKAVKVIVDESGVYADAGDEKDDIWVARSVGMIVRSMLQFAADDHVNSTLHDLKVQLRTADTYADANTEWSEWQQSPASKDEMHLQYEEDNPVLDYGLIDSEKKEHEFPALATATGWSKLEIRQCLEHDNGRLNSGSKQDLGDRDLTNLFSGLTTVIVRDDITGGSGSLSVSKTVGGDKGDKTKSFNFTVNLDKDIDGKFGEMIFANGVATFTLKHGESKTAIGLPAGAKYTVSEAEANKDGYTTTVKNDAGVIEKDKNILVSFINEKNSKPSVPDKPNSDKPKPNKPGKDKETVETGDQTRIGLYTSMLVISALSLVILLMWKRKKF